MFMMSPDFLLEDKDYAAELLRYACGDSAYHVPYRLLGEWSAQLSHLPPGDYKTAEQERLLALKTEALRTFAPVVVNWLGQEVKKPGSSPYPNLGKAIEYTDFVLTDAESVGIETAALRQKVKALLADRQS